MRSDSDRRSIMARLLERLEKRSVMNSSILGHRLAIRQRLETLCNEHNMRAYAPPISLCGDNAAMIAWAGLERLRKGLSDPFDVKARPRWPLDTLTA